jgi:hypothetical protein
MIDTAYHLFKNKVSLFKTRAIFICLDHGIVKLRDRCDANILCVNRNIIVEIMFRKLPQPECSYKKPLKAFCMSIQVFNVPCTKFNPCLFKSGTI